MSKTIISTKYMGETLPILRENKLFLHGDTGISWILPDKERFKLHRITKDFEHTRLGGLRQFNDSKDRYKFLQQASKILDRIVYTTQDYQTLLSGVSINATINVAGNGYFNTAHELIASNVLAKTFIDASHIEMKNWWENSQTVLADDIESFLNQLELAGAHVNKLVVKQFEPVNIAIKGDHLQVQCNPVMEPIHYLLFKNRTQLYPPVFWTKAEDYDSRNRLCDPWKWDGTIQIPIRGIKGFLKSLEGLSISYMAESDLDLEQLRKYLHD